MKLIHSRKRFLALFTAVMVISTLISTTVVRHTKVAAAGGEAVLDLDNINQNPVINFSALKGSDGKLRISNDATTGGFVSSGITNTSYLLTTSKISGDFTVEAKLKVTSRIQE